MVAKDNRTKTWVCLLWPESAPADWRKKLNSYHIQWICSPLHQPEPKDDEEAMGKEHYHIFFNFNSNKSQEQMNEITNSINASRAFKCINPVGYIRYMIHLDDPDKIQYSKDDIDSYGGIDAAQYFKVSFSQDRLTRHDVINFIIDNDIRYFNELVDIVIQMNNPDWDDLVCQRNSIFFTHYIKERNAKISNLYKKAAAKYDS